MNIETGELRVLPEMQKAYPNFVQVPKDVEQEALRELADQQSVFVDLSADSPLANFARSQRAKQSKQRKKMAKASKRRNRR